jgi:pyrroloquinoline quinone (PQQ) biosynthesis protein C
LDQRTSLLSLYDTFPFHKHPLWRAILNHELSLEELLRAEMQHYLRTKAGQSLRSEALENARGMSPKLFEALLETYLEECTNKKAGPSHLDLIARLLLQGGILQSQLDASQPTPGNSAAIALYRDITSRGAACHMLGAGVVEHHYSKLAPKIFEAYTGKYGMTPHQAETYLIHGPMDQVHSERALSILDEAIKLHGWNTIEQSIRDAFVATSLHYDGMLQAACGKIIYWNGEQP